MRKIVIVASFLTSFHLLEDLIWVLLGRYTDVSLWIVALAIIGMGIGGGVIVRTSRIRDFLGK